MGLLCWVCAINFYFWAKAFRPFTKIAVDILGVIKLRSCLIFAVIGRIGPCLLLSLALSDFLKSYNWSEVG
jgi:hypothetical protein